MRWRQNFGGLDLQHPDSLVILQPFQVIGASNFSISLQPGTGLLALVIKSILINMSCCHHSLEADHYLLFPTPFRPSPFMPPTLHHGQPLWFPLCLLSPWLFTAPQVYIIFPLSGIFSPDLTIWKSSNSSLQALLKHHGHFETSHYAVNHRFMCMEDVIVEVSYEHCQCDEH